MCCSTGELLHVIDDHNRVIFCCVPVGFAKIVSRYGFGVSWCKKVYIMHEGRHHINTLEYSRRIFVYISRNKILFNSSSFKDQPMGAVSVFTSEELPSPTLFEILPSIRDLIASLFVLRMSLC